MNKILFPKIGDVIACQNIYAFTDIFTSLLEKIHGSKSLNFRNLLLLGMTGTLESLLSAIALTQPHGFSMVWGIFAKSATTIHA